MVHHDIRRCFYSSAAMAKNICYLSHELPPQPLLASRDSLCCLLAVGVLPCYLSVSFSARAVGARGKSGTRILSKGRLYFYIMLLIWLIQYNKKCLLYPHPPPSDFRIPTMSNCKNASPVAAVSVSVVIVTLSSIHNIWDDTVNIIKVKSKEGIPTC